jgi:hypothetical protein
MTALVVIIIGLGLIGLGLLLPYLAFAFLGDESPNVEVPSIFFITIGVFLIAMEIMAAVVRGL